MRDYNGLSVKSVAHCLQSPDFLGVGKMPKSMFMIHIEK